MTKHIKEGEKRPFPRSKARSPDNLTRRRAKQILRKLNQSVLIKFENLPKDQQEDPLATISRENLSTLLHKAERNLAQKKAKQAKQLEKQQEQEDEPIIMLKKLKNEPSAGESIASSAVLRRKKITTKKRRARQKSKENLSRKSKIEANKKKKFSNKNYSKESVLKKRVLTKSLFRRGEASYARKKGASRFKLKKKKTIDFQGYLNKVVLSKQRTEDKILNFVDMQTNIQRQIQILSAKKAKGATPLRQKKLKANIIDSVFLGTTQPVPQKTAISTETEMNQKIDKINSFLVQLSNERETRHKIKQEKERYFFQKLQNRPKREDAQEKKIKNQIQLQVAEEVRRFEQKKSKRTGSSNRSQFDQRKNFNIRYYKKDNANNVIRKPSSSVPKQTLNFPKNMKSIHKPRDSSEMKTIELPRFSLSKPRRRSRLSKSLVKGDQRLPPIKDKPPILHKSIYAQNNVTKPKQAPINLGGSYRDMFLRRKRRETKSKRKKKIHETEQEENAFNDIDLTQTLEIKPENQGLSQKPSLETEELEPSINEQIDLLVGRMEKFKKKKGAIEYNILKQKIVTHLISLGHQQRGALDKTQGSGSREGELVGAKKRGSSRRRAPENGRSNFGKARREVY